MKRAVAVAFLVAGCQLPPDHVVGQPPDLAGFAPRDLSEIHPTEHALADLGGADLTPMQLAGNLLQVDGGTPLSTIVFSVTDGDTGLPTPARVIFRPPPASGFCESLTSGMFEVNSPNSSTGTVVSPGVLGSPEGVLLATGVGTVPVPPGHYELFITRGPEYEAVDTQVNVLSGQVTRVDAELDRSVDTRGWLAADMHVHTMSSFDSILPHDRRVISMVSNGIELIVTTDHNNAVDLSPTIANLGYGSDLVGTIVGEEFNFDPGHGGAYPLPYDPNKPAGGVPTWTEPTCTPGIGVQCTTAPQIFDIMHAQIPGVTVVTINHPIWYGADLGYFTNIEWGAGTGNPLPASMPTAGRFDAIEVLNGYWARRDVIGYLIADWMYLISQGYRVSALGNSDTHKINWVRAGWPRTYLRLPTDRPGEVTGEMLSQALLQNRAIATTGPFAQLSVDGADIGDTAIVKDGNVTIDLLVDAPGWMQVDTVRLFKNGLLDHEFAINPGHRPAFHTTLSEPVSGDTWYVLQAESLQPLPPDVVGEVSITNGYDMSPFVITNPVFVDGDGDGKFHPPPWGGLPLPFGQMRPPPPPGHNGTSGSGQGPPTKSFVGEGCGDARGEPSLDSRVAAERYLAPLVKP